MIVKLDVLIIENFIVDYFILFITSKTIKVNFKAKNGILSSIIGSFYVITLIIPELFIFSTLPFKIIIPILIVLFTFRKKDLIFNFKASMTYMLYSMLIAGMCVFIEYSSFFGGLGEGSINFCYKELLISLMLIYMVINRLIIYVKDRKNVTQLIYPVDIFINENKKSVRAFLDTGNELREPATNLPVIIVERNIFWDVNLDKKDKFYIPYNVINGGSGKLIGFMPDYIEISLQGEIEKKKVVIACCDGSLNKLKDYNALLSRGIL